MPMLLRPGLLALALSAAAAGSAASADLYGSMKDEPVAHRGAGGPCYVRGDVAYVWNENADGEYGLAWDGGLIEESVEDVWALDVGVGCGSARGLRGDLTLGHHFDRELVALDADDHEAFVGDFSSWTVMANAYYDIGQWDALVPYVGVGVGFAWNDLGEVSYAGTTIDGDEEVSLAWSLMAGVGYRLGRDLTLDVGYRYMDLGELSSGREEDVLGWEPELDVEDLSSHEVKVGLRYGFGSLF